VRDFSSRPVVRVIGFRAIDYCAKTANLKNKTFIEAQNMMITKQIYYF
jgi:hypothetical protein